MDLQGSRSEESESSVEVGEGSHQMSFGLATVFRYKELKKATNNFDSSLVLGGGGYGRVYLGKLHGQKVAIKKLYDDNPRILEQFFNEVTVLSRIRHSNLVTLLGCSNPHSRKMLLVYEFVPNGTVADHLHGQLPTLSWEARILIAIETAEVLSFLHASEPVIIHRDVKSSNILLDKALHAKVADLGICRLLPWDTTNVSTVPQGTVGYRDPEYDLYFKLTDKSDVYSFGVLLLELMTGKEVVDVNRGMDEIYLVPVALNKIMNKELEKLIDPELGYHSDCDVRRMVHSVAELACLCLQEKGEMRPSMLEVLTLLKGIKVGTKQIHGKDKGLQKVDVVDEAYVFSRKELAKATRSFDLSREIGSYGLDKAYLGKLPDGRLVAVKVLHNRNSKWLKHRVENLFPLRHKNIITLYGHTKPSLFQKTILVYEHVADANHTLTESLHVQDVTLAWALRLQIATETAEALTYLHSLRRHTLHGDLKTPNILLDSAFHVKVTGLELFNELPMSHGTLGYRDPQFNVNKGYIVNLKSDVYSFGVVLLELISGKQPEGVHRELPEFYMVRRAINNIINKDLERLVDPKLGYHSDCEVRKSINSVANLAFMCLQIDDHMRPSMMEILTVLKQIQDGIQQVQCKDRVLEQADVFGHFTKANIISSLSLYRQIGFHSSSLYREIGFCSATSFTIHTNSFEDCPNKIYLGNLNGQKVAAKIIANKSDHYLGWNEKLFDEVAIVSRLCHENLVTLYGCTDPRNRKMFIVYEHVPHGTVWDLIHGLRPLALNWATRIQIAIETADALSYLHSLEPPVIHNNVATNNILLDEGFHVKLAGLSLFIGWTAKEGVGVNGYIDPEIVNAKHSKLITIKSDVYSFGVVLAELISGIEAFDKEGRRRYLADIVLKKFRNSKLGELMDKKLDYGLKGIVTSVAELACRCLLPEGNLRPSMTEVLAALKEIGSDCNIDKFEKKKKN